MLDNPRDPAIKYPFDERYMSLDALRAGHSTDRDKVEAEIKEFTKREDGVGSEAEPPADLDFLET